jgi:hypothetical protein
MILTSVFNLRILTLRGEEYTAVLLYCPTLSDIKELLLSVIADLKQQAHQDDDIDMTEEAEYRVSRIWTRVTELQNLLAIVNNAVADPDVYRRPPYRVEVNMAGHYIGAIDVIETPAYTRCFVNMNHEVV